MSQEVEYYPIRVTSGILLHIGEGIYSSIAGAIKELVSNSYDADSPNVVISTDYPNFRTIKVVDTGHGMSEARFRQALASIGTSIKGSTQGARITRKYQRPIVGHLGIGLMALTQVCDRATIESQESDSKTKFVATLDFTDLKIGGETHKRAIKLLLAVQEQGGIQEIVKRSRDEARPVKERKEYNRLLAKLSEIEGEQLGYCMVLPGLPAQRGSHGTTVVLEDVIAPVRELLRDSDRSPEAIPKAYWKDGKPPTWDDYRSIVNSWSWEELCERMRDGTSGLMYQSLPGYHQFLWELALTTPVRYLSKGPVTINKRILETKKSQLEKLSFSLTVDSKSLAKPVLLPTGQLSRHGESLRESYDYTITALEYDGKVDSRRLSYSGYIFWQRKQIEPSTLRGLQIYIRNVGIGQYDHTFLNYSNVNPSHRFGQMSGEIYVDEGLEQALSVDRNSFRETDPHYRALQTEVWKALGTARRGEGVIGKSYDSFWNRKAEQENAKEKEHIAELSNIVLEASQGKAALRLSREKSLLPIEATRSRVVLYANSPQWPRSAAERRLAQRILVALRAGVAANASPEELLRTVEGLLLRERQPR